MKQFIGISHRFGHVFLRVVYMTRAGRTSRVAKIKPDMAEEIGRKMAELARRARKEKPSKPTLKLRKEQP